MYRRCSKCMKNRHTAKNSFRPTPKSSREYISTKRIIRTRCYLGVSTTFYDSWRLHAYRREYCVIVSPLPLPPLGIIIVELNLYREFYSTRAKN